MELILLNHLLNLNNNFYFSDILYTSTRKLRSLIEVTSLK